MNIDEQFRNGVVQNHINELKGEIVKLRAERDALKAAIQAVLEGNYPNPRSSREETGKCGHDVWWWEDCTQCVEEFLQAALQGEGK